MKEGWKMVKLGEVCDEFGEYGMSVSSKQYDGTRYIRITDITDNGSLNDDYVSADIDCIDEKYRLQEGDVLFARTGATVGKTLVYRNEFGDCVYAGYLIRYRPNLSIVLPQFLFYCTHYQKYYDWVKKNQKAAAQPNISAKLYNGYEIPLPPLEEQHRIVGILDAAFAKIDALKANAEANLKNAKALFQQVLAEELKPKEGWVEKKLGDFAYMKAGDFVKASDIHSYNEEGLYPCYGGNGLRGYVKEPNQKGDYCLVGRQGALCGCIHRVSGVYRTTEHAVIVKPYEEIPTSLVYYLLVALNLNKYATGAAQPGLSVKNISEIVKINIPPLEEQHRIVATLDALSEKCRRLEQVAQRTISECDALKQSILRQAFSGEL